MTSISLQHFREANGAYALREPTEVYGRKFAHGNELLSYKNTFCWEEIVDEATT